MLPEKEKEGSKRESLDAREQVRDEQKLRLKSTATISRVLAKKEKLPKFSWKKNHASRRRTARSFTGTAVCYRRLRPSPPLPASQPASSVTVPPSSSETTFPFAVVLLHFQFHLTQWLFLGYGLVRLIHVRPIDFQGGCRESERSATLTDAR